MKNLTALLLALVMVFALAACGTETVTVTATPVPTAEPTSEPSSEPSAEPSSEPSAEPSDAPAAGPSTAPTEAPESGAVGEPSGEGGNTLVVYFSATGHTEAIAGYIADITDADVFVIEPAQPYTSDDLNWTDESSRVVQEYEDESLRNIELVSTSVPNWDSCDTVFIGYPIWWGIAAWPVSSFVAANDFSGKTVIPFCTSSSSGLGDSGTLLAQAAGTGNWLEGMRFRSSASESDVSEWIASLGL